MSSKEINVMVEGLIAYSMEFEPSRPPAPIGIVPYSLVYFLSCYLSRKKEIIL